MKNKTCQNCKEEFFIKQEDFDFYSKINVPPPTFCPDCRFQRRLAYRNDRAWYRRECNLCKKKILSIYSLQSPIQNVYCPECWWSDNWDPFDYAKEYDFSRPFFEQYYEFKKTVPHQSVYQANFVSSEYCNFGLDFKDCYLVFGGWANERASYGNLIGDIIDSADIMFSTYLEFCYESINCTRCSRMRFCR